MGKYTKFQNRMKKPEKVLHPVWRGIGCVLWIIVPVMAYAAASLTVDLLAGNGMIPAEMLGFVQFPDWVYKAPFLSLAAQGIHSIRNLWSILIFFVVYALVLAGIASIAYASAYRVMGPPRYTALDAPPTGHKPTQKSR